MELNANEISRYARHFPVIGKAGQLKLKATAILCIGAGGLGAPVLQYLAASGVGTIGIVDGDCIELSNLQRQVLFTTDEIGQAKSTCAKKRINASNPEVKVIEYNHFITTDNADTIIKDFDIIVDCTDNYKTRYLVNDACAKLKKPLVSASIYQFAGQCSVFNKGTGPCYRCLYPEPPPSELVPNCALGGVLGVLPGLLGSIQAGEAIKLALDIGQSLSGRLLTFDMLNVTSKEYKVTKNDDCPCCQQGQSSEALFTTTDEKTTMTEITVKDLYQQLEKTNPTVFLLDVREPYERDICTIGGLLIPLAQLKEQLQQLPNDQQIVIYCKAGARSQKAAKLLHEHGYQNATSLQGGILQWIEEIDPSLNRY